MSSLKKDIIYFLHGNLDMLQVAISNLNRDIIILNLLEFKR